MDINYYRTITDWLKQQWQLLTILHIIYLIIFSSILSYITEYALKYREIRFLYFTIFILLIIKLVEGGHIVSATETFYKLALI